jgi:hypothetical protein
MSRGGQGLHAEEGYQLCLRCEAAIFEIGKGALSRTARDGGAPIEICPRCGTREGLYGHDAAKQPPFSKWPLSPETLADEERRLIAQFQRGEMFFAKVSPEDAAQILDQADDD